MIPSRRDIHQKMMASTDDQLTPAEQASLEAQLAQSETAAYYAAELTAIEQTLRESLQTRLQQQMLGVTRTPPVIRADGTAVSWGNVWRLAGWAVVALVTVWFVLWGRGANTVSPASVTATPIVGVVLNTVAPSEITATNTPPPTPTALNLTAQSLLPSPVAQTPTPLLLPPTPSYTPRPLLTVAAIANDQPVLFAYDNRLWRTAVDGSRVEALTDVETFHLPRGVNGEITTQPTFRLPFVSPNGRYITWLVGSVTKVVDILTGVVKTLPYPASALADWSPDSRWLAYSDHTFQRSSSDSLYIYDVESGIATQLLALSADENPLGLLNPVWSPDGQQLAFACCFSSVSNTGEVRRVDVASGEMATVRQMTASPGNMPPSICWTVDGRVVDRSDANARRCSFVPLSLVARSPDGSLRAVVLSRSEADGLRWYVVVEDANSGQMVWQRPLLNPFLDQFSRIVWSPDGRYIFFDDDNLVSPIWRIAADGSSEAEIIVEQGVLIDVVDAWLR